MARRWMFQSPATAPFSTFWGRKLYRTGKVVVGDRVLRLLQSGRVDPTPLTTHTFDFDDIETAFSMMQDKADGIIQPMIRLGRIRFYKLRPAAFKEIISR